MDAFIIRSSVKGGLWADAATATHAVWMQRTDGSWAWFAASVSDATTYARMHGESMAARIIDEPVSSGHVTDMDGASLLVGGQYQIVPTAQRYAWRIGRITRIGQGEAFIRYPHATVDVAVSFDDHDFRAM